MKNQLEPLIRQINQRIEEMGFGGNPESLYDPIRYIMSLGGKRMRPLLSLLTYKMYREDVERVLDQAIAVEVFHNFTLMHDDVMDEAPLRRGKPTVHQKWNTNTAILSGDVMLVKVYEAFSRSEPELLRPMLAAFNTCASEVCEGQQLDMEFETREMISDSDYLEMIRLKTAVLLGFSMQLGAMAAGQDEAEQQLLYEAGVNAGIGFQLMDDLLDVYADREKFGKQVGGDILANKKTFLLIKAWEKSNATQQAELKYWMDAEEFNPEEKIMAVKDIYDQLGIRDLTSNKMQEHFDRGLADLGKTNGKEKQKELLAAYFRMLISRDR